MGFFFQSKIFTFCFLTVFVCIVSPTAFAYFYPESYKASRLEFRETAEFMKQQFPDLKLQAHPVPTDTGEELTIESLFIPQKGEAHRLLIVTSGIHGVEAFTGAAIQIEFLKQYFDPQWIKETGFLFIHAVNPYGYQFHRRVDEQNVDLNRNMSATERQFSRTSPDYTYMESFLNPKKELDASTWGDIQLFAKSIIKLIQMGRKAIAQVALGGQYQNPKGIYYGGSESRPNPKIIKEVFEQHGQDYGKILHVDLHTGYGVRGKLHFFSSPKLAQLPGFSDIFSGYDIDMGSDKNFYETYGDFGSFTREVFKNKEWVIPMTFEFGTMDSQTILGGFYSLRNMIYENQGHNWGYKNETSEKTAKKDFLDMFNPPDPAWRDKVLKDGTQTLKTTVDRYIQI